MLDNPPIVNEHFNKQYANFYKLFIKLKIRRATHRQFIFAKIFLETHDMELAFKKAGYADNSDQPRAKQRANYRRVLNSVNVRKLIEIATYQWAAKTGFTTEKYVNKLLNIVDTSEKMSDQLEALRMLNEVLGFDEVTQAWRQRTLNYRSKLDAIQRPYVSKVEQLSVD